MTRFWICNYARCNYGRVLNIPGFRVCQVSAYVRVSQCSEYGWIMFCGRVLNIPGPRIWQVCEYAKVIQGAEYVCISLHYALILSQYAWICLNNTEYD